MNENQKAGPRSRWRVGIHRGIIRVLDGMIAVLSMLFSKAGMVWVAAICLMAASVCGWLEIPLQGVIRGYAFDLSGDVGPDDALTNPARLLSVAWPCLLAAGLALGSRAWRRHYRLPAHIGAALLIVVLWVPITVTSRNHLVEGLFNRNQERDAIRAFAALVGGYSSVLPAIDLPGTSTLMDRSGTVFRLIGYGWWFALVGAGLLIITGFAAAGHRRALPFVAGWGGATLLILGSSAAPAVIAEYHRLEGETSYTRGQYETALSRFRQALRWAPDLRENQAFQYRIGATLFWMGDRTSSQARLFLAQNLRSQGDFEKARLQLTLAFVGELESPLIRRNLAEVYAVLGIQEARPGKYTGKDSHWERARELDENLVRIRYYLAHAYYRSDERDQTRAIAQARQLITVTRDRGVLADLYGLIGDCYFKAGQDAQARAMYRKSLEVIPLTKQLNLKAQEGLLGL